MNEKSNNPSHLTASGEWRVTILTKGRGGNDGEKCIFGRQHAWAVGPWPGLIDPATGTYHTDGVHHWCVDCGRRKKVERVDHVAEAHREFIANPTAETARRRLATDPNPDRSRRCREKVADLTDRRLRSNLDCFEDGAKRPCSFWHAALVIEVAERRERDGALMSCASEYGEEMGRRVMAFADALSPSVEIQDVITYLLQQAECRGDFPDDDSAARMLDRALNNYESEAGDGDDIAQSSAEHYDLLLASLPAEVQA